MKIVLVTSQITYIKQNYQIFISNIIKNFSDDIVGVIIIKNRSLKLLFKIIWLYFIGCKNVSKTLFKNFFITFLGQKEKFLCQNNISVLKTKNINNKKVYNWIKSLETDIIVNARGRCFFGQKLLNSPKIGCINIHHGLLPKYRGLFCDIRALADKRDSGFSIHQMTNKIDEGTIFFKKIVLANNDYLQYLSLVEKEEIIGLENILKYIKKHNQFPKGENSKLLEVVSFTNPTKKEIKNFLNNGIIL